MLQVVFITYIGELMKINSKKLIKIVKSCFQKISSTVSLNLIQQISSTKPIQIGPISKVREQYTGSFQALFWAWIYVGYTSCYAWEPYPTGVIFNLNDLVEGFWVFTKPGGLWWEGGLGVILV